MSIYVTHPKEFVDVLFLVGWRAGVAKENVGNAICFVPEAILFFACSM
jgi:hypothetical protein